MNVRLHIERLILDGISLLPGEGPLLQAAMESELQRLLANGGLCDALQSGGALYHVRTDGIQLANDGGATQLGQQIAGAVYGGLGNEGRPGEPSNPSGKTNASVIYSEPGGGHSHAISSH
jgi:hypothetical protein